MGSCIASSADNQEHRSYPNSLETITIKKYDTPPLLKDVGIIMDSCIAQAGPRVNRIRHVRTAM
jgi:hypothetical protein